METLIRNNRRALVRLLDRIVDWKASASPEASPPRCCIGADYEKRESVVSTLP